MKRWLEKQGYAFGYWLAVKATYRQGRWRRLELIWNAVWWRYYCPRPVIDDWSVRACIMSCNCGCSNLDRYAMAPADRGGE